MRQWILNVLYLGLKEIASVLRDVAMVGLRAAVQNSATEAAG